jgi:hypothetical protein
MALCPKSAGRVPANDRFPTARMASFGITRVDGDLRSHPFAPVAQAQQKLNKSVTELTPPDAITGIVIFLSQFHSASRFWVFPWCHRGKYQYK